MNEWNKLSTRLHDFNRKHWTLVFVRLSICVYFSCCEYKNPLWHILHTENKNTEEEEWNESFPAAACCQASLRNDTKALQWHRTMMMRGHASEDIQLYGSGAPCCLQEHTALLSWWWWCLFMWISLVFPMRRPQQTRWPRSTWCGSPISLCSFLQGKQTKHLKRSL